MLKKYSIYNTILKLNKDNGLCFCAMSDEFVLLRKQAYNDLLRLSPEELREENRILYDQLVRVNGIIDADINEVELLRNRIRSIDNDDTTFHLHINPTVDCNFRCWYCYEDHKKGSRMHPEMVEKVEKLISNVLEEYKNLSDFNLSFFGGEPLMHFAYVAQPLTDYLYTACKKKDVEPHIHFTTNGYLLTGKMIDFLSNKSVSFQITLDGDKENHDRTRFMANGKGSFDKIVNNIKLLARAKHTIIVRINYTSANIESIQNICDMFNDLDSTTKRQITIDFQRVWQDEGKAAEEDNVNWLVMDCAKSFMSNGIRVVTSNTRNSVTEPCYGDKKNYALVNFDGNVFQCTARDFTQENRYGYVNDTGKIEYVDKRKEERLNIRFSKRICHSCKIAPICGGGCAQKAMENKDSEKCVLSNNFDIERYILNRFEYKMLNMANEKCIIN